MTHEEFKLYRVDLGIATYYIWHPGADLNYYLKNESSKIQVRAYRWMLRWRVSSLLLGRMNEQYIDSLSRTPFCKRALNIRCREKGYVTCDQGSNNQWVTKLVHSFCSISTIPWSILRIKPSLCRTRSGSVQQFPDSLWTPKVLSSHFVQRRAKLPHWSLSRGEAKKKSLYLTARATEQEKALAWRVSDAFASPWWNILYREEGGDKWQEEVCVWKMLCVCVWWWCLCCVIFLWRVEKVTLTATVPFSFPWAWC